MTTVPSPLARAWRRWISLLLALALGFSSVEIAWAEAFDSDDGRAACASGGGDAPRDAVCSPDEAQAPDADEDCPCLCACACPGAQRAVSSAPMVFPPVPPTSFPPTRESARAPRTVAPVPQLRPPVA